MPKQILKDNVRVDINRVLRDLREAQEQIKLAEEAKLPWAQSAKQRCTNCLDTLERIKAVYFPSKP